eukprot:2581307-Amphidinium_carterae.1
MSVKWTSEALHAERGIFRFLMNAQNVSWWSGLACVGNLSSTKGQRQRDGRAAAAYIPCC